MPRCSSASLPWESPRCPIECAGLGRRLPLATATARQPEPPQSPPLPPTPPDPASVAPCAPARRLSWCGCPVLHPPVGPHCQAGLWGLPGCGPVSLTGSEKAVGVPPAPVEQDVAQTVSHWGFPSPHRGSPLVLLGGQCCGHTAVVQTEFPSSLSSLSLTEGCLGLIAWQGPALTSPDLPACLLHTAQSSRYPCQHPVGNTSVPGQDTGSQCGDSCETEATSEGSLPRDQTGSQV